jgi:hypothetical protein
MLIVIIMRGEDDWLTVKVSIGQVKIFERRIYVARSSTEVLRPS